MAAEAALVAEELGKIVSAQQIFVLRKAIYRLTAHSTNPHAVLCAHLPLRSARGALRQRRSRRATAAKSRLRSARGALRQSITTTGCAESGPVVIRTECAEAKVVDRDHPVCPDVVIRTECVEAKNAVKQKSGLTIVVIRTECAETKCNPTPRRRLGLGCDPHAVR